MTQLLIRTFVKGYQDPRDPAVRTAYGQLAGIVGILCNVLLFAGKFTVGMVFGSIAVTADAVNNLSDASSNVVSLLGFKLGAKKPDEKHPYGYARYEYLAGLAVSVMILVIGLSLLKESALKILHPEAVTFSVLSVTVLAASILVKLWMSVFNKKIGESISSETLIATAADSRNDVISTAAGHGALPGDGRCRHRRRDGPFGGAVHPVGRRGPGAGYAEPAAGRKPGPGAGGPHRRKGVQLSGRAGRT